MPDIDPSLWLARRREQVRSILEERRLDAIVLRRFPNFAWYTGGAESRVDHSSPDGIADIVVTGDADFVLPNTIEGARMRAEQTLDFQIEEYPWYQDPPLRALAGTRLGTDFPLEGATDVSAPLAILRRVLDPLAIERYRKVGADTQAACREAAEQLVPGMTEWAMMAVLEAACRCRGLYSPVAMAAAEDRIAAYRHPVTAGAIAHRRVMLVVCAERGGLYANMTAWVHFEEPESIWLDRQRACDTILRRLRQEMTRPGRTLAEVFADIQRLYAEEGYADQWRFHHQGGITGYATREVVATPTTPDLIRAGQAFAWNPSILGAKAEETFVLTETGPEILATAS